MILDDVGELKYMISFYLSLPDSISGLEFKLYMVSPRFYCHRSFTGGMSLKTVGTDLYQRATNPEYGVLEILAAEDKLKAEITRSTDRYKRFTEEFSPTIIRKLTLDNKRSDRTKLERKAYSYIKEIETYIHFKYFGTEFDEEEEFLDFNDASSFDKLLEGLV